MNTFSQDSALPPLPVPELPATCAAVAELAAPLVDAQILDSLSADLEEFSRPGGAGEKLQSLLLERAMALPGNQSWLRPLWDDMYLAWREPLPVNMNYFFHFDARRWGGEAALPRLVSALVGVFARLARQELEPEQTRNGFLAMEQAASCLYTRIPCRGRDVLFPVTPAAGARVSVVCRGHWFLLDLPGETPDAEALGAAFAAIRKEAALLPPAVAIGALSAAPREEAAALRAALQEVPQNRLSLAALEKSLFTVCLDPPAEGEDFAAALLGGDAANRFFDKSLQIVASENGEIGANFEHAGCDAAIWVYLLNRVDEMSAAAPAVPAAPEREDSGKSYRLLAWDVPLVLRGRLAALRADFERRTRDVDLCCKTFPGFGRNRLKGLGTSPDAFLQLAFQVAQHRIFGRLRSSYEAISVRSFAQGRTECARGSSGEALAFALALQKGCDGKKLLELYRQAERIHKSRLERCQRGLGIERHLYGLHAMWRLHGAVSGIHEPAIFRNPAWKALKHDALSTSGIGAPYIRFFGFGPVAADGFGIGYAPEAAQTGLAVSAFRSSGLAAASFAEAFAAAARGIAAVLAGDGA